LAALFFSNIAVFLLEGFLVEETRPFLTLPHVKLLLAENAKLFLSLRTRCSSFATTTVIGLKYKINIKNKDYRLIYPPISNKGFSRIYIRVHYSLDVIFGAIVGVISAFLVPKNRRQYSSRQDYNNI
jgi:undecaprenyl-diphosphatase